MFSVLNIVNKLLSNFFSIEKLQFTGHAYLKPRRWFFPSKLQWPIALELGGLIDQWGPRKLELIDQSEAAAFLVTSDRDQ